MYRLVRCLTCNEIFFRTPYDQWPEYEYPPPLSPAIFRMVEKDDYQDFLEHHQNHPMEHLEILQDSFISEKPYSEPMKISYFKATNGKEKFVVKKFRTRIDEPLAYQLIPGDYSLKLLRLEIEPEAISKQLEKEIHPSLISKTQREAFLKLFQKVLKTIDIKNLERIPEESPHPLEIYYKLDDISLAYLLRNCRNIFKGQAYQEIEAFIDRHREDGVLLLKATYQIKIHEDTKKKKISIPIQNALNEKRYIEKK